jgi:hypothetical protein
MGWCDCVCPAGEISGLEGACLRGPKIRETRTRRVSVAVTGAAHRGLVVMGPSRASRSSNRKRTCAESVGFCFASCERRCALGVCDVMKARIQVEIRLVCAVFTMGSHASGMNQLRTLHGRVV